MSHILDFIKLLSTLPNFFDSISGFVRSFLIPFFFLIIIVLVVKLILEILPG